MSSWRDRDRGNGFSNLDEHDLEESGSTMKVKPERIGAGFTDSHNANHRSGIEPVPRQGLPKVPRVELPGIELSGSDVNGKPSRAQRCLFRTAFTVRFLVRFMGIGIMAVVMFVAVVHWPSWAIDEEQFRHRVLTTLFASALFLVAMEDVVGINKSAVMLLLAATMWTFLAVGYHPRMSKSGAYQLHTELDKGLKDVGSVILFLLPAMGVVESIDHFDGFAIVTAFIRRGMSGHPRRLMPIICILTFFLSSVIDNLTSTIVALKILRHLVDDREFRHQCGSLAVLASNAGGAWSPIGDVTTTMLWIATKITTGPTVAWLLLPSFVAGVFPLGGIMWQTRRMELRRQACPISPPRSRNVSPTRRKNGRDDEAAAVVDDVSSSDGTADKAYDAEDPQLVAPVDIRKTIVREEITRSKVAVLLLGIFSILLVPVLKITTGLPPYLGMLLALGLMWLITDMAGLEAHGEGVQDVTHPQPQTGHESGPPQNGVVEALKKVDLTGLLFFTGVLLSVGALDSAGVLHEYATQMVKTIGKSPVVLCTILGLSSSVVDNVPLVEATIDMFREVPENDPLWQLIALTAGTGGSLLSIGSIAGVTLMSMEGVGFLWYARNITVWALLGFAMGIFTYQLQRIAVYGL